MERKGEREERFRRKRGNAVSGLKRAWQRLEEERVRAIV